MLLFAVLFTVQLQVGVAGPRARATSEMSSVAMTALGGECVQVVTPLAVGEGHLASGSATGTAPGTAPGQGGGHTVSHTAQHSVPNHPATGRPGGPRLRQQAARDLRHVQHVAWRKKGVLTHDDTGWADS